MTEREDKPGYVVLCGANAYEEKYYFNPLFDKVPESVKEELKVICVLFTQEAGGIFTIGFDEDGEIDLQALSEEEDITYDNVSAALLRSEVRRKRADVFNMLELYYRVIVKGEDAEAVLEEI